MQVIDILPKLEKKLEVGYNLLNNDYSRVKRHEIRVMNICEYIAKDMKLPEENILALKVAARYHDYPKCFWSLKMSRAPREELSDFEINLIYTHPTAASELVKNDLVNEKELLEWVENSQVLDIIRYHHKDFDGGGYPKTDKNILLPLEAKILRVADSYDAMRSPRSYRSPRNRMMLHNRAIDIIIDKKGTEFSPEAVESFLKIHRKKLDRLYSDVRDVPSLHTY